MYCITRVVTRNLNDRNPARSHFDNIDCDQTELGRTVLFALRQLAKAENLKYKSIGSDTRILFEVKPIDVKGIDQLTNKVTNLIQHYVSVYNNEVKTRNKLTTKRNKADAKPADANIEFEVNIKDYSIVNVFQQNYISVNNTIIVEDAEPVVKLAQV